MSARIAVVTGANRGIGLEVAAELARKGSAVIATARSNEKADLAREKFAALGLDVGVEVLDITDDMSVAAFFQRIGDRVDVLVNNAGAIFESDFGAPPTTLEVSAAIIQQTINTNALGAWRMAAHALPLMQKTGYGRIVNVSSGMGQLSEMGGGYPAYRISKTAMNATTKILHAETGNPDIKVNSVCPGWVRTDMGGPSATRSIAEGAAGIVWAATLPADGPSGGFFRDGEVLDW